MITRKRERSPDPVPAFANAQEAAPFWHTHSPLDYREGFDQAEVSIARTVRERELTVTLDQATVDRLITIAAEQGVDPSTLARMWILEHLQARPVEPTGGRTPPG